MAEDQCKQLAKAAVELKVLKKSKNESPALFLPFKMVLEPFEMNQEEFKRINKASYLWQKMTHLAADDYQFLKTTLSHTHNDPMITPVWKIYQESYKKNYVLRRKPKLQLFRTDYFITDNGQKIIQYNNLCVSMAGISSSYQNSVRNLCQYKDIPQNRALEVYSKSLNRLYTENNMDGIVILVVKEGETNTVDQQKLINQILKEKNFEILPVILSDLIESLEVDQKGDLFFQKKHKVSIIYFRAGYSPEQFTQSFIQVKRKIQLSNCVPVPSTGAELVGQKRIQAELSKKQIALKFLTPQEVDIVMSTVIDTWDFEEENNEKYQQIICMVEKEGIENFVLKPNAEGGNHNYFGVDAYEKLKNLTPEQRGNYILTRRIAPRRFQGHLINSDSNGNVEKIEKLEIDSEVSIYGTVYSNQKEFTNEVDGFLVRCKPIHVNEGGLMSGHGAIGSLKFIQN